MSMVAFTPWARDRANSDRPSRLDFLIERACVTLNHQVELAAPTSLTSVSWSRMITEFLGLLNKLFIQRVLLVRRTLFVTQIYKSRNEGK